MDRDRVNNGNIPQSGRWQSLDLLRGVALVTMAIYHFTWDLSFFRYIGAHVATSAGWALFAKSIAASFLFLSGISLALALRNGLQRGPFLRRLAQISAAALGVSLATAYALPHAPVLFGILHCMAAVSVLLLPFRTLPAPAAIAAAMLIFMAPIVLASTAFDGQAFAWLGLNVTPLSTVDHVPLLPWAGWAFLGFGLMRIFLDRETTQAAVASIAGWKSGHGLSRALQIAGRHSLAVYLLHQPMLLGLLWLMVPAPDPAQDFRTSCVKSCSIGQADTLTCTRYCDCMVQTMSQRPLWKNALANALTAEEMKEATALSAQCQRAPGAQP